MTKNLVSIIVPVHDRECHILECLQSLHDQTHERLELIVIDDCSIDRTFDLVKDLLTTSFADRFEHIELHRKLEARGIHDSLNLGIELAKGDYVAIANGDDLFVPRRLERLLEAMRDTGSEFAFSLVDVLDEIAQKTTIPQSMLLLRLRQQLALARDPTVAFALLRSDVTISIGNIMLSLAIAKKIGGVQPLKYYYGWDFALQATVYTEPVAVPEPLYRYRWHSDAEFQEYLRLAELEIEVVHRRFFRSVLGQRTPNRLCPAPQNWPGYFEVMIRDLGLWDSWVKEAGERLSSWRIYERPDWGAMAQHGAVRSVETAVRLLYDNLTRRRKLITTIDSSLASAPLQASEIRLEIT